MESQSLLLTEVKDIGPDTVISGLTFACGGVIDHQHRTAVLQQGDPLGPVLTVSERYVEFAF